jgi:hypothetical protein
MASKMARAKEFLRRRREQAKGVIQQMRTDAETYVAGGGIAYARGRFGDESMRVSDIDLELIIGATSKLAAYTNVLGKSVSPDLHAVGNGVLTTYAAFQLLALGKEHREQDSVLQAGMPIATEGVRGLGRGGVRGIPRAAHRRAA